MPLDYSKPEEDLARDLREVARDAQALIVTLQKLVNLVIPAEFPKNELIDIATTLVELPAGTAEGCRSKLDYARDRLPAIRDEHIQSEELETPGGDPDSLPPLQRAGQVDQALTRLIGSVSTARAKYWRLTAELPAEDVKREAGVAASGELTGEAVAKSAKLETTLTQAKATVDKTTKPDSSKADDLKRQIIDALGLNRLAGTELRMPKIVVSWYRRTVEALKDYPGLIEKTANGLRDGADIAEIGLDRWHEFERNLSRFFVKEFKETCDALIAVADRLRDRKRSNRVPVVGEVFQDIPGGPEMVVVPADSFMMGSPRGEKGRSNDEGPRHKVTIPNAFAVGRHAVTRGQFAAFVKATAHQAEGAYVWTEKDWKHDPKASWRGPGFGQDDSHPVVCMNWDDAKAYAAWLADKTGKPYRLLSEAEWEYAARAGTAEPFWWGTSITPEQANYDSNYVYEGGGSKGEYRKGTVPVGSFAPNPWGLYNVHGNVWEWCEDIWHDTYKGAPSDGSAWLGRGNASRRVVRGGSWSSIPRNLRSACRLRITTDIRSKDIGFRLGRTLTP